MTFQLPYAKILVLILFPLMCVLVFCHLLLNPLLFSVPKSLLDAINHDGWRLVVEEEMKALEHNDTWNFVSLPLGTQSIGCKLVYTVKMNQDGFCGPLKSTTSC